MVENTRFYSVTTADIDLDSEVEIIAAGQINNGKEKNHSAYIAVFKRKNSVFRKVSELSFSINHQGANIPARIRNIQIIPRKGMEILFYVSSGRAGEEESGIGFIQYVKLHLDHISLKGYHKFVNSKTN